MVTTTPADVDAPLSLRSYARHRAALGLPGQSTEAVRKAIDSGRLSGAVVEVGGQRKIRSAEAADRAWAANTRAERSPASSIAQGVPQTATAPTSAPPPPAAVDDDIDYAEARRRREVELWRQARVKREGDELELALRKGELVDVTEAQAEAEALFSEARTKLLGVPTRARQRMQHLTADDVRMLDELIREAMEAFADGAQ
jgi:hypothetical protein